MVLFSFFFSNSKQLVLKYCIPMDCCHQFNIFSVHIHIFTCCRAHREHVVLLYLSFQTLFSHSSSNYGKTLGDVRHFNEFKKKTYILCTPQFTPTHFSVCLRNSCFSYSLYFKLTVPAKKRKGCWNSNIWGITFLSFPSLPLSYIFPFTITFLVMLQS